MSHKLTNLKINNFVVDEIEVDFDPNVTYLVGRNGSAKSTVGLAAIWAVFQGIAERSKTAMVAERYRFIANNGKTAQLQLTLHDTKLNCDITVFRKITKDATFLSFQAPKDYPVELNQEWLNDLFNVFLINPKKFLALNAKEQALALGIDTTEYDAKLKELRSERATKQATLKSIQESIAKSFPDGVPEVIPAIIDLEPLRAKKKQVEEENRKEMDDFRAMKSNAENTVREYNQKQTANADEIARYDNQIAELEAKLKAVKEQRDRVPKPLELKAVPEFVEPELKDTSVIDMEIDSAIELNRQNSVFQSASGLLAQVNEINARLEVLNQEGKAKAKERLEYIQGFKLPMKELAINEEGELLFRDRPMNTTYFSSGELVKIVPVIQAAMNPELKFVFLQDFNDLDDENREKLITYLNDKGFQLLIEMVGTQKVKDSHTILLKDGCVVESYEEKKENSII